MTEIELRHKRHLVWMRGFLAGKGWYDAMKALELVRELEVGVRKDGVTPKFHHQLSVARLLTTLVHCFEYPQEVITTAFLHDILEDHGEVVPLAELEARFGKIVSDAVWSLTKKCVGLVKDKPTYFNGLGGDPIASLVKGADRIHNVQTMTDVFSLEKQRVYVSEVGEWFLPMMKNARHRFPEQAFAYENLKIILRVQCGLLEASW